MSHFNSRPCGRGDPLDAAPRTPGGISIHAPAGGATSCRCRLRWQSEFQFTPLREGRRVSCAGLSPVGIFQFTPLREGRHAELKRRVDDVEFQFTPLREGRRPLPGKHQAGLYFNSRPCGRGDNRLSSGTALQTNFNSRPCGRGDSKRVQKKKMTIVPFAEKRGKFILL